MNSTHSFLSDTLAGSANQSFVKTDGAPKVCRVFYKLFGGGSQYKIYFADTVFSTFADGSHSVCNTELGGWSIYGMTAGICRDCGMDVPASPKEVLKVTFGGKDKITVSAGEEAETDVININAKSGDYLCLSYVVEGEKHPCHPEIQIPAFSFKNGAWIKDANIPVPYKVGVKRMAKKTVCFLGDSITQGIGATPNGYTHWASVAADIIGTSYAFHNLGIGYGRASDTAAEGIWLNKAKEYDVCVLCMGTNDILQGATAEKTAENVLKTAFALEKAGVKVLLQAIPPFEYSEECALRQKKANELLKAHFPSIFNNNDFLCENGNVAKPLYGGHPNDMGCKIWGTKIAEYIKERI